MLVMILTFAACGSDTTTVATWTTSGTLVNERETDSWFISVGRANGHIRRDATFAADSLELVQIRSFNADGEITLTFTQGDSETVIDLSGGLDGFMNLIQFEPGTIGIRLDFNNATDIDIYIDWSGTTGFR